MKWPTVQKSVENRKSKVIKKVEIAYCAKKRKQNPTLSFRDKDKLSGPINNSLVGLGKSRTF